ncbi:MAG: sugar ABC transporter permease [Halanaerobacter sp.]
MQPKSSTALKTDSIQRWISSVLSVIYMGLGQLVNKQYLKGLLFMLYHSVILFININFSFVTFGNVNFSFLPFQALKIPIINLSFEPFYLFNYLQQKIVGLYTLGTTPIEHHSLFFLIKGLVAILFVILLLAIYIFNVVDAYKNGELADKGEEVPNFTESWDHFLEIGFPYIGISPSMIVLLAATVFPVVFTVCLAFVNYDANHLPPRAILSWVGLENFKALLTLSMFKNAFISVFLWTVIWAVASTILSYGLGLFVAVVLNHKRIKFRNIFRTILLVPWAIPAFVSILIWRYLLNSNFGHVNELLQMLGMAKVNWLNGSPLVAKIAILVVNLWLSFPFAMAVCSGILQSISETLYEAAIVDGATVLQKFFHITLPLVLRQVTPLLIMQFAFQFNNFGIIFLLNKGNPAVPEYYSAGAGGTDILISWVYKLIINKELYSYGAAISIIIFFVVAGFSIYQFRQSDAFQEEELR